MVSIILLDKNKSEEALVRNVIHPLDPRPSLTYFHRCSEVETFLYNLPAEGYDGTCVVLLADFFQCIETPWKLLFRLRDHPPAVPVVVISQSFSLETYGGDITENIRGLGVQYFISKEDLFDDYQEKLLSIISSVSEKKCTKSHARA